MEIRRVDDVAALVEAAGLFDHPSQVEAHAPRFVSTPGHVVLVAYEDDGQPAGFVSGVEMAHPDKGAEMFLYELSVDEAFRGRGIGTALVSAMRDLAREQGCSGMWVLTDADNAAALGAYRRAGGGPPSPQVMLEWDLSAGDRPERS